MLKIITNQIILILICFCSKAQMGHSTYTLSGYINTDSGVVRLIPIDSKNYYPATKSQNETKIIGGRFKFTNTILYPYAYRIGVYSNTSPVYISGIFFLDTGKQTIICNIDSSWETPNIRNKQMNEYMQKYKTSFSFVKERVASINVYRDSLTLVYKSNIPSENIRLMKDLEKSAKRLEDETLLKYVEQNKNSFVAFWELISKVSDSYQSIYDTIFITFSKSLHQTYAGKALNETINVQKQTSIGQTFKKITCLNREFKKTRLPPSNNSKYTLIDFWFSYCNPCISQFKELNDIFSEYHYKGFDIIGISTDSKKNIQEWENVIKKQNLLWNQFLDLNGKEAYKLRITKYPSNFLLNERGEIIARDIDPFELKQFLKSSL